MQMQSTVKLIIAVIYRSTPSSVLYLLFLAWVKASDAQEHVFPLIFTIFMTAMPEKRGWCLMYIHRKFFYSIKFLKTHVCL